LGLYQFERNAPAARRDQAMPETPAAAGQTRADAAASLVPSKLNEAGGACTAQLTSTERGVISLTMADPARSGQAMPIAIDDVSYGARFDAKGVLRFDAPMLAQRSVVRWEQSGGSPCEKPVVMPATGGLLRVALVSPGGAALDLHVIEPNAWFGGPSGHISAFNANMDQKHGAGLIQAFGDGKGGARAQVYSVEASRIAPGGVLNAFVKPVTASAKDGAACADKQVLYQVLILRQAAQTGDVQTETRSFAMAIGACGASGGADDRSERIIVRN
jgi:hypothetical protein